MVENPDVRYCIVCGEAFLPSEPDEVRCPEHGGQGRPVGDEGDPAGDPQRTKLDPAGPGEPTRLDDGEPVQTEADVPVEWEIGDRILDLYEVKGVLGAGGFGVVYRVHHTGWDLDLAVKSPLQSALKKGGTEDFVSEAEDWMDLGLHPHITTCHYVRTLGGVPRVFAELVEGGSLHDWMTKGRLYEGTQEEILKRLLDIAVQFAWGLDYAHEQGMIHQDVKPENALMTEAGSVKVTDFGLVSAKAVDEGVKVKAGDRKENKSLLAQGKGMTPAYCSPEQSMGQMLSRRTDLWSWGLSLLALFAGERFWGKRAQWATGPLAEDSLNHYLEEGPKRAGIPPMPDGLVSLLQEVFQEDPEDRPHNMDLVAHRVIETYEQELGEPYPREKPEAAELRADSLNNRALSLMDLGREEEAEDAWQQALDLDPYHPEVSFNHGLWLWRNGKQTDQAFILNLKLVTDVISDREYGQYLLGLVHMERGDQKSTLTMFEEASKSSDHRQEVKKAYSYAINLPHRTCIAEFLGHEDAVSALDISRDGRKFVSGSHDKTIRSWDLRSRRNHRVMEGHENAIHSLSLTPCGTRCLSGSLGELWLWDLDTGKSIRRFEGVAGWINGVAVDGEGEFAVSGNSGGVLQIWEIETGRCLRNLEEHRREIEAVAVSFDSSYILSGGWDQKVRLWDLRTGHCLKVLKGHKNSIQAVAITPDGKWGVSGTGLTGELYSLRLWDLVRGECVRVLEGHTGSITSLDFSADGRKMISSALDSTVRLWDISSGRCIRTFDTRDSGIEVATITQDGEQVLTGGFDKKIRLWEVGGIPHQSAKWILSQPVRTGKISQEAQKIKHMKSRAKKELQRGNPKAAWNIIQSALTVSGYESDPVLVSLGNKAGVTGGYREGLTAVRCCSILQGHKSWVGAVALTPDGEEILSGSGDHRIHLWALHSGRLKRTYQSHEKGVYTLSVSKDGETFISGSSDKTLRLWDRSTGKCIHVLRGHEYAIEEVILLADDRFALSCSSGERMNLSTDQTLRLWNVEDKSTEGIFYHEDSLHSLAVSPDERFVATGDDDETIKLWNLITGEMLHIFKGHENVVSSVSFTPNGKYLISGSWDHTIRVWDLEDRKGVNLFQGHTSSINSLDVFGNGRFAISASKDKTLRVWSIDDGKCLAVLEGHKGPVWDVTVSRDGQYAVSASNDHTLRVWNLTWEYRFPERRSWNSGAKYDLEVFIRQHIPLKQRKHERTWNLAWTERDFQALIRQLGYRGYGWLRPEGVRRKLQEMARERG